MILCKLSCGVRWNIFNRYSGNAHSCFFAVSIVNSPSFCYLEGSIWPTVAFFGAVGEDRKCWEGFFVSFRYYQHLPYAEKGVLPEVGYKEAFSIDLIGGNDSVSHCVSSRPYGSMLELRRGNASSEDSKRGRCGRSSRGKDLVLFFVWTLRILSQWVTHVTYLLFLINDGIRLELWLDWLSVLGVGMGFILDYLYFDAIFMGHCHLLEFVRLIKLLNTLIN